MVFFCFFVFFFFFFKQKTAYEILRSDWSSDVCSSDLLILPQIEQGNLHELLGVTKYSLRDVLAGLNPNLPHPAQGEALQTPLAAFVCPSDSNDGLIHRQKHFGGGKGTSAAGLGNFRPSISNYVGNRGTRN